MISPTGVTSDTAPRPMHPQAEIIGLLNAVGAQSNLSCLSTRSVREYRQSLALTKTANFMRAAIPPSPAPQSHLCQIPRPPDACPFWELRTDVKRQKKKRSESLVSPDVPKIPHLRLCWISPLPLLIRKAWTCAPPDHQGKFVLSPSRAICKVNSKRHGNQLAEDSGEF